MLDPIEPVAPSSVTERGTGASSTLASGCFFFIALLPYQQAAGRCSGSRANEADKESGYSSDEEAVEAIHEAAVTRNEVACVLGPKAPLDGKLEQVAGLRQDGQQQRHYAYNPQPADTARISDPDAGGNPSDEPPQRTRPSLFRTDARPQQGATDCPTAKVGKNISYPDGCEEK